MKEKGVDIQKLKKNEIYLIIFSLRRHPYIK